ncbi:MAG: aminoglycoside phosphotransferase family protein, partial [Candidatus Binatia bacterium]
MAIDSLESARVFASGIVADLWPGAAVASVDPMRGDASTRSYARVRLTGAAAGAPSTLVLMMMQDAAVAMSSEELGVFGKDGPKELAFVNVGRFLAGLTDAVPTIHAVSPDSRLLLLEDVGDTPLWEAAAASPAETFGRALDLLADLQARATDDGSGCYAFVQSFDEKLFAWEFEHFLEYGVAGAAPDLMAESRRELRAVAARLAALPRVFSHRDYHAWNIHVQPAEPGRDRNAPNTRLRLIDFQDALLAPALYDVASLLTDRNTPERITAGIEESLLVRFYSRQKAGRLESLAATRSAYRLIALQRVLKVVGRFHYLAEVKGKPHYLGLLPAVCQTARRLLASSEGVAATAVLFETAGRDPSRVEIRPIVRATPAPPEIAPEVAPEIAADVARRLLDSCREHGDPVPSELRTLGPKFEVDVPVTAPWAGSQGGR